MCSGVGDEMCSGVPVVHTVHTCTCTSHLLTESDDLMASSMTSLSEENTLLYLIHVKLAMNNFRQERGMGMGLAPFYSTR